MPKKQEFVVPSISQIKTHDGVVFWLRDLALTLNLAFRTIKDYMMPYTGVGRTTNQTVTAGFTVTEDGWIIYLDSASDVTSSTTMAIKASQDGATLLLVNIGTFNIIMKDHAGTHMAGDFTMRPNCSMFFVYSSALTSWIEVSRANN